jgi:aspartyl-tRNA(Asn)/glutamyl-tRNA(Gln) amidotransferase subunit C
MKKGNEVISGEEIRHLARLAKIEVSEKEEALLTTQLNNVLVFFREIEKVETSDIPPTFHVTKAKNVLREDAIELSLPRDEALSNATRRENGYFKAPKIV